ncbi:hypothetical protein H2248_000987 [Termitomyces sp. 'cryptogamus']|nr:hypothetical protein H2248_000987 [Termitomyces sp. 'cryptogamus']
MRSYVDYQKLVCSITGTNVQVDDKHFESVTRSAMTESLQAKLQLASAEFQKTQGELSTAVEARQRLDAQLSENELVKKEFALLKPENRVFKLLGPVLVKQDQVEAKSNIETRLEFIRSEIKRVEAQLQDIQGRQDKKKVEIIEIQTALQQLQTQQAPKPVQHLGMVAA